MPSLKPGKLIGVSCLYYAPRDGNEPFRFQRALANLAYVDDIAQRMISRVAGCWRKFVSDASP
ncbi:hypothetical protein ACNKHX_06355 [Shigella flexneri]